VVGAEFAGGDQADDGCTQFHEAEDGTKFYSIVVASYAADGRSIFAIADPGRHAVYVENRTSITASDEMGFRRSSVRDASTLTPGALTL
jgi:hypothetical protein